MSEKLVVLSPRDLLIKRRKKHIKGPLSREERKKLRFIETAWRTLGWPREKRIKAMAKYKLTPAEERRLSARHKSLEELIDEEVRAYGFKKRAKRRA